MNFIVGARPWLRSLRATSRRCRRTGDEHPALPRGHLLVGVEGEGRRVAAGPDLAPVGAHGRRAPARHPRSARAGRRMRSPRSPPSPPESRRCGPGGCRRSPHQPRPRRGRGRSSGSPDRRRRTPAEHLRTAGSWRRRRSSAASSGPRRRDPIRARARRGGAPPCRWRPRRPGRRGSRPESARSPSNRGTIGPSESIPERITSRTSSSSRSPRTGRASGMRVALTAAPGPAGRRTRASRRGPPTMPRSRSRRRPASSRHALRRRNRAAPSSPRRCRGARRGSGP